LILLAVAERSKRGSVAISHSFCLVTCRITSPACIQTFHFFLPFSPRQDNTTHKFIAPPNIHHNLDRL
jgi:hypothetical protein